MKSKRIAFIWQGLEDMKEKWEDGLAMAMKQLEKIYEVEYLEPEYDLDGYDALIYWEAPCTINGENAQNYLKVKNHSTPKILLFAGGPINPKWVEGFDTVVIESEINREEFANFGIETTKAFGINTDLFKPYKVKKKYKAVHHGTCASWKRQWLLPQAFGEDSALIGRNQEKDSYPFIYSKELGAKILGELKGKELVKAVNSADVLVQSSDFWGGGQRATLEAMACGIPVICMSDSPKNIEYIQASGGGLVSEPDPESIKRAYDDIMKDYQTFSKRARDYVLQNWTWKHYAFNLNQAICNLKKK